MSTYAELFIPSVRKLRHSGYSGAALDFLKAHAKEMRRCHAQAWNWGWAISETGIASKTNYGILETDIRDGIVNHRWSRQ